MIDVAVGSEKFGIPAIRPVVTPRALRPAMNEELHGILLVGVEVRWLDYEALDFLLGRSGEPEILQRLHLDLAKALGR